MIIRDNFKKFSLLFSIVLIVFLVGFSLGAVFNIGNSSIQVLGALAVWLGFYAATRVFRSQGESSAPRPLWKVTDSLGAVKFSILLLVLSGINNYFSDYRNIYVLIIELFVFIVLCINFVKLKKEK